MKVKLTDQQMTNKIDWQNVLKIFPDRTLSQCKSFYFNQVKPYIFKPGGELTKENMLDQQQFWDILKEVEVTLKTMNI
ncbi:SANT/Myb_domain [Hexamita inflata]|uniref:SANT/Myb_domain n=1 Tax=Hexamita inflata TaxID=28002 RepID=A0ABP1KHR6_9EUKA